MLQFRLIFGFLMALGVVALLALDWWLETAGHTDASPGLLALSLLLAPLGGREFYRITRETGADPFTPLGVVLIACSLMAAWWVGWSVGYRHHEVSPVTAALMAYSVALGIGSVFLAQGLRGHTEKSVFNIAATLLGVLYLGVLGGFLLLFRFASGSVWAMLMFLAIVKSADIGAYFTGRALGRHKLIPWLSPGKTWEGTAGGLTLSAALALGFGLAFGGDIWLPPMTSVAFALPTAVIGQLGDLAKSLLKRDAHRKDSGASIPGFGGVLDVIDSPLMAAPTAYILWIVLPRWSISGN